MTVLLVLGILVFLIVVHELGHFLAAKWAGVYAPRFSLGWGKGLLAKDSLVTLAAVGAGFNFGASAWRWAIQPPTPGSSDVSGL